MKMMISCSEEETNNKNKKFCVDCKTTKTPLWRGGPAGPKSLCNACGIRCRKKRRAAQALKNAGSEKKPKNKGRSENGDGDGKGGGAELNDSLKMSLMALGKDFYLQRLMMASVVKKQRWQRRRKLCEEELAAVSLLALSCSSVYS